MILRIVIMNRGAAKNDNHVSRVILSPSKGMLCSFY